MNLTTEQYQALVKLARAGATDPLSLDQFLAEIEKANGIKRYYLRVRWQNADYSLPPTTRFPESWPPQLDGAIERFDRPIAAADVEELLQAQAKNPVTVMVTLDPNGRVGWTNYPDYFNR